MFCGSEVQRNKYSEPTLRLGLVILNAFSNLNDFMILYS